MNITYDLLPTDVKDDMPHLYFTESSSLDLIESIHSPVAISDYKWYLNNLGIQQAILFIVDLVFKEKTTEKTHIIKFNHIEVDPISNVINFYGEHDKS